MVGLLDIVHWIFLQVLPSCSLSICTYLDSKHTDLWMYHCFTSTLRLKIEFYDSLILMQKKKHIGKQWTWWWTPNFGKKKKKHAPGPRPQAVPEPVAWTLPSDSDARGRCVASKRFGGTTPDPPRREALVNHGFSNGFSRDLQWKTMDFPSFQWIFQWFSNELWIFQWKPMIFQWFSRENPKQKPWIFPWNMEIPVDFTPKSIHRTIVNPRWYRNSPKMHVLKLS